MRLNPTLLRTSLLGCALLSVSSCQTGPSDITGKPFAAITLRFES